jgi:hypothetical protein
VLVTGALAWGTRTPVAIKSSGECWTLASVPGPEDLVLVPAGDAALVSSQDRRDDPMPPGAIWYVPLDRAAPARSPRRLTLRGRDDCSFHPHGIDLVTTNQGTTLLYVINHHHPEDLAVARACFDAIGRTKPRASVTSVEVFEYRNGELYFLQRLADPEILTGGNDLVAEDDGDLWVTIPPGSAFGFLVELVGYTRSKLAHFDCERDLDLDARCTGTWWEVKLPFETPPRYVNGIEIDRDSQPDRLYLASTAGKRILVATIERGKDDDERGTEKRDSGPPALRELGFHRVGGMPDNLLWSDKGELLVAAHADSRRFLQHSRSASTPSPWKVFSLPAGDAPGGSPGAEREPAALELQDAGGRVSAASVAASIRGDFVLGQVYGPGVARCRPDRSAAAKGETR